MPSTLPKSSPKPSSVSAGASVAAKASASVASTAPDQRQSRALSRTTSWREFEESDPLYATIGELGERKVITPSGTIDSECLESYLQRLMRPGVVEKLKGWVEVWAAMNIPVEPAIQSEVIQAILQVGLASEVADTVPAIVAELIKGHRVKVKAVEEAIQTLFECGTDEQGFLAGLLLLIFPKSPTSEWGWSRVGWNWQQWWITAERVFETLEASSAFDVLCTLLRSLETDSGTYLPHQQIWDEKRLATVRAALCKYGNIVEDDLSSVFDLCLS